MKTYVFVFVQGKNKLMSCQTVMKGLGKKGMRVREGGGERDEGKGEGKGETFLIFDAG